MTSVRNRTCGQSGGGRRLRGAVSAQGDYAEAIAVHEDFVLTVPESLPLEKVAPLLCAGVTLYSPLRHWNAGPGTKVAIVGPTSTYSARGVLPQDPGDGPEFAGSQRVRAVDEGEFDACAAVDDRVTR
ncbi:MAG: hypothetical protein ABIQ18_42340 [Umezawaea sp.]